MKYLTPLSSNGDVTRLTSTTDTLPELSTDLRVGDGGTGSDDGWDVLEAWCAEQDDDDPDDWPERALCAQTDPEAFFPEKGGSTREAKRICSGCDVRAECLDFALAHDERFGIWGGLSERERRRLRSDWMPTLHPGGLAEFLLLPPDGGGVES